MPSFIALLRGVNIGPAKRVPMSDLRTLLAELGYARIATILNGGNAVSHAAKGAASIHALHVEGTIATRLKVDVPVIVKSGRQLGAIVAENPLSVEATHHSRLLVAFTQDARALRGLAAIEALLPAPERFVLTRNAGYLLCSYGIPESRAGAALLGKGGRFATTRDWATVLKLQALASAPDR
jgi:uncharacterized protein (DUF1697 family)